MKKCRNCHNLMRPKPLQRGGVEAPSQFRARQFCSRHCWKEWKRLHARSAVDKLERLHEEVLGARRFSGGDPIWYERSTEDSFGWPIRVPAEFVTYLDDYGRSRVVIIVFRPDGSEHSVWTQERKLLARTEALLEVRRTA